MLTSEALAPHMSFESRKKMGFLALEHSSFMLFKAFMSSQAWEDLLVCVIGHFWLWQLDSCLLKALMERYTSWGEKRRGIQFAPALAVSQQRCETPTSPQLLGNMRCFCWEADRRLTSVSMLPLAWPWRQEVKQSPLNTIKWAITALFKLPGGADIGHVGVFTHLHCSLFPRPKAG